MTKMTEREFLNAVAAILDTTDTESTNELSDYITGRLTKLDERNANRKPTKKQQDNEKLRARLLDIMETGKPYTVTELTKLDDFFGTPLSVSKISAIVKPLLASDEDENAPIERTVVKGKAYYTKH